MKSRYYLIIGLLLIPVQASLLTPLSIGGIRPDLGLAVLYIIGLLTGPVEAAMAGMAIGLLQDIGSSSLIGLTGITRGLAGLAAGLLGRQVLNIASPSNSVFLAAFSLAEGICITIFLQALYGSVPFFSLLATRILPQAVYTGLAGTLLLRFIGSRDVVNALRRRADPREF